MEEVIGKGGLGVGVEIEEEGGVSLGVGEEATEGDGTELTLLNLKDFRYT